MIESYLKRLTSVLAIGAAFAAIPLFASFSKLEPPWPPAIGYVSAALVLVSSLLAWEWTRSAKRRLRRTWIVVAVLMTLAGLLAYLVLYSLFVENIPGSSDRLVRGYVCTREATLIYPGECPDLPRRALQDNGWEAVGLWTRQSVTFARIGLTFAWLLFTAGLIAVVGSIVAGRNAPDGPRAAKRRR